MNGLLASGITVCIDIADLPSFVAFEPTVRLLRDFPVPVNWLPLGGGLARLSARQPSSSDDDPLAAYKARRARARETWAERELARNCERLGIDPAQGARSFDSTVAGVGLLYASQAGEDEIEFLRRLFQEAWVRGAPIEDAAFVATLFDSPGFEEYVANEGVAEFERLQGELLDAGVFNSPAYVLDGEVFQGRQHLPVIRWKLGGAEGIPPT